MIQIGKLESVWRYPMKSMRGEEIDDVFIAYTGVMGYVLLCQSVPLSGEVWVDCDV